MIKEKLKRKSSPRRNIDNQVFGYLTVLEYHGGGKQSCKCICGKETIVATGSLIAGLRTSCGCKKYYRETSSECNKCGVVLSDKNKAHPRKYKNGKIAKSSVCRHCKSKATFCFYTYENPDLEKLSLKKSVYVTNQVCYYKNKDVYKQKDSLYKKKLTADLDDKYVVKVLLRDGYSKQDITSELIENRRRELKDYREKTGYSCFEDYVKYEYKGVMYNQTDYCKVLAKESGFSFSIIKSRVKNNWSLQDILNTPPYKLPEKTRKAYGEKMGAKVKIYDLEDNLLFECNTYNEAAELLGTSQTNIVNTCTRLGIFNNKYKIRSSSSSIEKKELLLKKAKANNENWCRITYPTPELNALASKRSAEITYDIYYAQNKEIIYQRVKEYAAKIFDVRKEYNKQYYATNRDYKMAKNREWAIRNKEYLDKYHLQYRKTASDNLTDAYIKGCLIRTIGLKVSDITPEMVEIKRKQVELYRTLKQMI
jgi:hypothetical protein